MTVPLDARNREGEQVLKAVLDIPTHPSTIATRGGFYNPELNIWVAEGLNAMIEEAPATQNDFWLRMAEVAIVAGSLHRQQLSDAAEGRIWPAAWLKKEAGRELIEFCEAHPLATSPYTIVNAQAGKVIPYTHVYQQELARIQDILSRTVGKTGTEFSTLSPYITAMDKAFAYEHSRLSDNAAMAELDVAWLQIPDDSRWLIIAEFTETYSDPLKPIMGNDPQVNEWVKEMIKRNGVGVWKCFFEFRLLELMDTVVTPAEIEAIRFTIRELYTAATTNIPSLHARTEFRRVLINAGHGAFPPKSAKNYPNQVAIRRDVGYRNIIFANQAEQKVRTEMIPALQAAFDTTWANDPKLADQMLCAHALYVVAHEETHPWVRFSELTWLEELKCDVLGMYALLKTPMLTENIADIVISAVAGALQLHQQLQSLASRDKTQLWDYYVGDTIFLTHLADGGFFNYNAAGRILDVRRELAAPLLEQFVHRILSIKREELSPSTLLDELFRDGSVYGQFRQ
jgi:hypothetical protein